MNKRKIFLTFLIFTLIFCNISIATEHNLSGDNRPNFIDDVYEEKNTILPIMSLILASVLFIVMLVVDMRDDRVSAKLKIINLIIGIIIGALLVLGINLLNPINRFNGRRNLNKEIPNRIEKMDEERIP